jgi:S-adenosylmethionine uptake transporter
VRSPLIPFLVAALGTAIFCVMDALMKSLGLALGAYSALLWRTGVGVVLTGALWASTRPALPAPALLRLHVARGVLVAAMAMLWFHAITLVPLAEAIAITFFAPLLATWLASLFLKEAISPRAVTGSCMGLAGVGVIVAGRLGADHGDRIVEGIAAVIVSAILYAINLVVQRHQAQQAGPQEIAFFQTGTVLLCLLPFAPWAAVTPVAAQWPAIVAAALFAGVSLLLLSWAYARAEAQVLVPTEYTGFIWLALLGWWYFGEELTVTTFAGAALIVAGCLLAIRQPARAPQEALL